jgi:hypothetical protein
LIAYESDESGQFEIYVYEYPSGGKWIISPDGGTSPRWSADGSELFYLSGSDIMAVPIERGNGFRAGAPRSLFRRSCPTSATPFVASWFTSSTGTTRIGRTPDSMGGVVRVSNSRSTTVRDESICPSSLCVALLESSLIDETGRCLAGIGLSV